MAALHPADVKPATPQSRETLWAIIASFVLSIILATVVAGNPLGDLGRAYLDYEQTPAATAAAAGLTQAPPAAVGQAPAAPK